MHNRTKQDKPLQSDGAVIKKAIISTCV